jgi:hypothetical protein
VRTFDDTGGAERRASRARAPGDGAAALLERAAGAAVAVARAVARFPPVQLLARAGFVGKSTLYGVVGALALRASLGLRGGGTIDAKEALSIVFEGGRGNGAVAVLAVALGGLGFWFVLEGAIDPSGAPLTPFRAVSRIGQAVGGLGYLALAAVAVRIVSGEGAGPSGDEIVRMLVGQYVALPTGRWAVAIVGVAAVIVGARQVWLGISGACLASLTLERVPRRLRRSARALAVVGFPAQGGLFALVGVFLVQAALERDPGEATGTGGALHAVAASPYGSWLLLIASTGLLACAAYAGIEAATRRMPRP